MLNRQANMFWDRGCAKDFGWLDDKKMKATERKLISKDPLDWDLFRCLWSHNPVCKVLWQLKGKKASWSSESVLICRFFLIFFNCHFISSKKLVFVSLNMLGFGWVSRCFAEVLVWPPLDGATLLWSHSFQSAIQPKTIDDSVADFNTCEVWTVFLFRGVTLHASWKYTRPNQILNLGITVLWEWKHLSGRPWSSSCGDCISTLQLWFTLCELSAKIK